MEVETDTDNSFLETDNDSVSDWDTGETYEVDDNSAASGARNEHSADGEFEAFHPEKGGFYQGTDDDEKDFGILIGFPNGDCRFVNTQPSMVAG
ncbi:MAG: hypothetical protein ACR2NA_09890 [Solirubrobacterales bacterium]